MDRTCVFEAGNYKIICKDIGDIVRDKKTHHTQVIFQGERPWHVDLWNMEVNSWEDANALIRAFSGLMYDITKGVEEACSKK